MDNVLAILFLSMLVFLYGCIYIVFGTGWAITGITLILFYLFTKVID